jgi:hypothetical protein
MSSLLFAVTPGAPHTFVILTAVAGFARRHDRPGAPGVAVDPLVALSNE